MTPEEFRKKMKLEKGYGSYGRQAEKPVNL
jgi:stalled ribosome alternative rescue factor ArfA